MAGSPWPPSSKIVVRVTLARRGVVLGGAGLGDDRAGLGIEARPFEHDPAVETGQVVRVGQPDVDDGETARREVVGERLECGALGGPGRQHEQRVEGDERQAETAGVGQAQADDVRLDEGQAILAGVAAGPPARPVEHGRVEVDAGDQVAGLGQRDGQPAGPDRELEDRTLGAIGQREIQVEVARVVDEVEVVQAGQGRRRRRIGPVERQSMVSPPSGCARRRGAGRPAR